MALSSHCLVSNAKYCSKYKVGLGLNIYLMHNGGTLNYYCWLLIYTLELVVHILSRAPCQGSFPGILGSPGDPWPSGNSEDLWKWNPRALLHTLGEYLISQGQLHCAAGVLAA